MGYTNNDRRLAAKNSIATSDMNFLKKSSQAKLFSDFESFSTKVLVENLFAVVQTSSLSLLSGSLLKVFLLKYLVRSSSFEFNALILESF